MRKRKIIEGYSRKQIGDRIALALLAFYAFGLLHGAIWTRFGWIGVVFLWSLLLALFYWTRRWLDEGLNYELGEIGETKVLALLQLLSEDDYWFANDIVIGNSQNIDHIVVGKNGVWVIETKHQEGAVRVQGDTLSIDGRTKSKYLSSVRQNAAELHSYLAARGCGVPWVRGVLVFSRAGADVEIPQEVCEKIKVSVVNFRQLIQLLRGTQVKAMLTSDHINKIKDAIERRPVARQQ